MENENGQLKYLLSWYNFDERDINEIIDNNVRVIDWKQKPKVQEIREEIVKKRFKCEDYLESLEKGK